ncbi:MAG: endolytic transglycosylase MltG [Treponema sp.]|nr:endolytic transglycosylase MltG [Treponema sp.]
MTRKASHTLPGRKSSKEQHPSQDPLQRGGPVLKGIRAVCKVLSVLIVTAILISGMVVGAFVYCNSPPDSPAEFLGDALRIYGDGTMYIEIRNGESAISVGRRLENAGIIRTRYFWNLVSRLNREYIKTGTYRISIPATQLGIRAILISGQQLLTRVTVPEGVTLKKIAQILEDADICNGAAFLDAASDQRILDEYRIPGKTMEGYLYPDTYLFPAAYRAPQVVRILADTFFRRLEEIAEDALSLSPEELNNRIILASIVEREYRADDEAPIMAGVFYNRLKIGMALQSCATVEYVITEIQGKPHPSVLYDRDIQIRDPYNTYIRSGLPPGPISAPGPVALKAVFYPDSSEYLYFRLVDPAAGRHYFSRTFDEHIRAGVLYVKGRGL